MSDEEDAAIVAALRAKLAAAEADIDNLIASDHADARKLRAELAAAKRERDEALAEVAEADGVIAVWRRRTETAERERDAALALLAKARPLALATLNVALRWNDHNYDNGDSHD